MTKNPRRTFKQTTHLPGYHVEKLIGEGGMSKVFRATELRAGRKVAIKFLKKRFLGKRSVVSRFHQEAELARTLDHRYICKVFDVGIDPTGTPYFVMDLLRGRTLAELIKAETPLTIPRAIDLAHQILEALEEAHRHFIVHRDIKPSNIFVIKEDTGAEKIKLLDFGISKILDYETGSISLGDIPIGTLYYLAPEQASGEESDHRADIFSVGVVLYELMTGERPFVDQNKRAVLFKRTAVAPKAPRRINPNISKELEAVILKALNRDPQRRFSSAAEMRFVLESISPLALWGRDDRKTSDATAHDLSSSSLYLPQFARKPPFHRRKSVLVLLAIALISLALLVVLYWRLY